MDAVRTLSISADGRYIVAGTNDNFVYLLYHPIPRQTTLSPLLLALLILTELRGQLIILTLVFVIILTGTGAVMIILILKEK
ncbi:MAG: hypothetical protein ACTSO9_21420 [Candidatus Helarchaeota archaeon]